jgi:uncharacterized protein YndB with AHSA1/START domain
MNSQPFVIERVFDVPVKNVWDALTQNEQMKKWYFNLPDFKAVPGFEFTFTGGEAGITQYKHLCKITEVIPGKKLAYSWRYDGYRGQSLVSFELFEEGKGTRLKLTHAGLESFARSGPHFAQEKFVQGWTHILDKSLKGFLETASVGA